MLQISLLVTILGLVVVGAAAFSTVNSFSTNTEVEENWQTSKAAAELGAMSMEKLESAMGYGGLIHNFKNYVLRREQKYFDAVIEKYTEIQTITETYLAQPYVSEREREAYTTALKTMGQYKAKALYISSLPTEALRVAEIDSLVKIDDGPALEAIDTIRNEWKIRQDEFRAQFRAFFRHLNTQNNYGLILIGLLCLVILGSIASAIGLRRVIHQFQLESKMRQQAETQLQKHSNNLQRSNNDLRQFAYVASHDLRSPLRAIANLADWIEEDLADTLEGETKEHMDMMRSRIKRLDALLNDLLEYSRASNSKFESESVELADVVGEARDILVNHESENLKVTSQLPTLNAPRAVIATALRNLVNNALKHHDKEAKTVTLAVTEDEDYYYIHVADDGPGIPAEFHEKAFQMFTTLRSRDEVEGSGMGLALIARQLQNYGGKLQLKSPLNNSRGTEFTIEWPKNPNYEALS